MDDEEPFMLNLDGEYGGDTPVELEVCHNHIEFFVNRNEIAAESISAEENELN